MQTGNPGFYSSASDVGHKHPETYACDFPQRPKKNPKCACELEYGDCCACELEYPIDLANSLNSELVAK